jgi:2-polyprenyl-3-methyl-5-hydroxy-6-metoxy-1,4-benzoquinol methylase
MSQPPEYLRGNVDFWQKEATKIARYGEEAWASSHPYWGICEIPESDIGPLPADMSGLACIELDCGTAYVSAWMCRRGASIVAIDPTPNQLKTARRLQKEYELDFVREKALRQQVRRGHLSLQTARRVKT